MAQKQATVFCSRRLFYGMDKLSKNALIDILIDRAKAEIGENATDEQLADTIQQWITPVAQYRNDKAPMLRACLVKIDQISDAYLKTHGRPLPS